jgi:glycosyltransferase involved in cell wall biosynthesis
MRILVITNLYPNPYFPHRGMFNWQPIQTLAAEHPVEVIAPISWIEERRARRGGANRMPRGRTLTTGGFRVHHPSYVYPPKMLRRWYGHFFRRSIRPTFKRVVAEFQPEVVYASWAYPDGWAAVDLAQEAGLPAVVKVHGSDILTLDQFPARRARTREALARADAVLAVSQDLAGHVVALGADPSRVHVIYCGINVHLFSPGDRGEARRRLGLADKGPILLFVGNLVPVKGLPVLIEACSLLVQRGLAFSAYLIGEGPERPALQNHIDRRGLGERVRLVGPWPLQALPDWYRAADLFVLPSHSEGVPNVLLEAAACGTPFVASRVGGIPEIARFGTAELVPPGDAPQLAQAIAKQMTRSAGEAQARYMRGHEDMIREMVDIMEQLVQRRQPIPAAKSALVPARQEAY